MNRLPSPLVCGSCGRRANDGEVPFLLCASCAQVAYCGSDCQTKHWSKHRKSCGGGSSTSSSKRKGKNVPEAEIIAPKRPRKKKLCQKPDCEKSAANTGNTDFCCAHGGGKKCEYPEGCEKNAQGSTNYCIAHGGGRRCQEPGCGKCAVAGGGGKTPSLCIAHGGGKRCQEPGCVKSAKGPTDRCQAHGGGTRCREPGCNKLAWSTSDRCKAHGGGNKCEQ